jgi:hypothetical protein
MNRYRVIARALELRAGPGTGYEILEQLPNGEALEQVPPDPHWTKVRRISDGRIGWVYNAYVRPVAHVPPTWDAWTFWQHTDGHVGPSPREVAGAGPVDCDRFAGDEQALAEFWAAKT